MRTLESGSVRTSAGHAGPRANDPLRAALKNPPTPVTCRRVFLAVLGEFMPKCLDCDADIILKPDVEVGEIVDCPDCGTEFEVRSLDPVKLDHAPQEEEDWGE